MYVSKKQAARATRIFREQGGLLRTKEALARGIHRRTLYYLHDTQRLDQISRGVYRLADLPPLASPDLVTVAARVPGAVVCLLSALAFHELTTQVPHQVHLALRRGKSEPVLDHPPLRVFRFSGLAFSEGIGTHEMEGVTVKVYHAEKTVADCFKFRNKIGLDVAIEALKRYLERPGASLHDLLHYARICRVENVLQPYLEALV